MCEQDAAKQIDIGRFLKIDISRLFIIDMHHQVWLPFLMIFAVVVNTSIYINLLELNILSYMVLAMVLLSFVIMMYFYLKGGTLSKLVLMSIIFELVIMTSSIINGTDIKQSFYEGCSVIFIFMACDYYKDRFYMLIIAFAVSLSICVYLNFLHLLTHPDLWIIDDQKTNKGYLLGGNYNGMGCRLLCAVGLSIACLKHSKWWLLNVIPVTLISIVSLGIVGSMTSMTGIILLLTFCFIPSRKLLKTGIISLIAVVILFQIFVCFQGKGIEQNELAVWFIEDVLGKDITFTQRTYLWDAASKVFVESPLYGYGLVTGDWYYSNMSSLAKGPHNFIWAILIFGGIILLALFTIICFMVFVRLPETKDRSILYIYATAAVMFLMMTMEYYPLPFIFSLLALAYFAPQENHEQEEGYNEDFLVHNDANDV